MAIMIPIMLYGWIVFTIYLFSRYEVYQAITFSVLGSFLLLPAAVSYDLFLFELNKATASPIGIYIGLLTKGKKISFGRLILSDLSIFIFLIFSPVMTSLLNGLGLKDGVVSSIGKFMTIGSYYIFGRAFFYKREHVLFVCKSIIISALVYVPFCLVELRMSPMMNIWVYGYFQHQWLQHYRYGGYRPIVFMTHGLSLALFLQTGFTISFWFWRLGIVKRLGKYSMGYVSLILFIMTIAEKALAIISYCLISIILCLLYKNAKRKSLLFLLLSCVPIYLTFRLSGILSTDAVQKYFSYLFDPERIASLVFRLFHEDLFCNKLKERPFFGWGGWGRSFPVNPVTGGLATVRDSFWILIYSINGLVGLVSIYFSLIIGSWKLVSWSYLSKFKELVVVIIVIGFFLINSLVNAPQNAIYIMLTGMMLSVFVNKDKYYQYKCG